MHHVSSPVKLLVLLLSADALLVGLHLAYAYTPYLGDPRYSISRDRGFGEVYQYTKEFWIVVMLAWMAIRNFRPLYVAWMLIFGYILADDSFQLHERLGAIIADRLGYLPQLGLRAQDFGELTVWAAFGLPLLGFLGVAYLLSDVDLRRFSRRLTLIFVALLAFGLLGDMIEIIVENTVGWHLLGIVDDGGEMVVMSVACWYVFSQPIARRGSAA